MKNQVLFFGDVSRNSEHNFHLDTSPPVELFLNIGNHLNDAFLKKANTILKNIQETIKMAKNDLITSCQPGGNHENKMKDFKELMLIYMPNNKSDTI